VHHDYARSPVIEHCNANVLLLPLSLSLSSLAGCAPVGMPGMLPEAANRLSFARHHELAALDALPQTRKGAKTALELVAIEVGDIGDIGDREPVERKMRRAFSSWRHPAAACARPRIGSSLSASR
jgi:hypothetical protein